MNVKNIFLTILISIVSSGVYAVSCSEKIEKVLDEEKPETFVIAGDLKHEFGEISNQ